jgi:hypothetical protein
VGDIVLEKLRGVGVAKGHALSEKLNNALDKAFLNSRLFNDPASMKWSKMLTNLLANPTSAILDMTAGEVFANRSLYKIEIDMLKECLAVMKRRDSKWSTCRVHLSVRWRMRRNCLCGFRSRCWVAPRARDAAPRCHPSTLTCTPVAEKVKWNTFTARLFEQERSSMCRHL